MSSKLFLWILATSVLLQTGVARYNDAKCCRSAASLSAFSPTPTGSIICGQEYNSSLPAADTLHISYNFCKQNCDGFGLSEAGQPSSWAAPIVQFILPSVIFSMSIPRRKLIMIQRKHTDARSPRKRGVLWSSLSAFFQLASVTIDNVIWIALILAFAGPMMLSALHEAQLDWHILSVLQKVTDAMEPRFFVEMLTTVVSGNLRHTAVLEYDKDKNSIKFADGDPQIEIVDKILASKQDEERATQLLGLVDAQMGYGAIVGAPVLFYLGAFIYTILDLSNKPSDQDAAISLAFGVEWMIIVHVAIIAGGVLATNNPSAASILVGKPPLEGSVRSSSSHFLSRLYDGELWGFQLVNLFHNRYQPVTMWSRDKNKESWLCNTSIYRDINSAGSNVQTTKEDMERIRMGLRVSRRSWLFFVFFPGCILIIVPPLAGAIVAYETPPVGFGCRSLSFICYAGSQTLVSALFIIRQYVFTQHDDNARTSWRRYTFDFIYGCAAFVSLFLVFGGTLMQVIGVYRNCLCYTNTPDWPHLDRALVQVASDTENQRHSDRNWIVMGGAATGLMGLVCALGWWYQKVIRTRYRDIVKRRFGQATSTTRTNPGSHSGFVHVVQASSTESVRSAYTGIPRSRTPTSYKSSATTGSDMEMTSPLLQ